MKRTVLMSIKPKYVKQIINGKKLFEFRKIIFDHKQVNRVIIYASSPVKKIVAEFAISKIIADEPTKLWKICNKYGGIEEKTFMAYFEGKQKAFSIVIDNLKIYDNPIDPYSLIEKFRPPQSYMYFDNKIDILESALSDF